MVLRLLMQQTTEPLFLGPGAETVERWRQQVAENDRRAEVHRGITLFSHLLVFRCRLSEGGC